MAVLTLAQYKALTGITGTDNDTQLSAIITATQATVERLLGLKFETTTLTEWYTVPQAAQSIQLRTYPIQSVTSVQVYYSPTEYLTIDSDNYRANLDMGLLSFTGFDWGWYGSSGNYQTSLELTDWPAIPQEGVLNYKIIYVGGSASASSDTALQQAMQQAVDYFYAKAGEDPARRSESVLDHSISFGALDNRTAASYLREIFGGYMNGGNL